MRRGRQSRHANPPVSSAIRPGLQGGQYRPLTAFDVENIHRTVLDILEDVGVGKPIPVLVELSLIHI